MSVPCDASMRVSPAAMTWSAKPKGFLYCTRVSLELAGGANACPWDRMVTLRSFISIDWIILNFLPGSVTGSSKVWNASDNHVTGSLAPGGVTLSPFATRDEFWPAKKFEKSCPMLFRSSPLCRMIRPDNCETVTEWGARDRFWAVSASDILLAEHNYDGQ